MDVDYPAAHSMDTAFFAVDQDGHVAFLRTGEAGALPEEAALEDPYQLLTEVVRHSAPGEWVLDLAGRIPPGPLGERGRHWTKEVTHDSAALLFLKSLDSVQRELDQGQAEAVAAHGCAAVIFRRMSAAVARRMHKDGDCLGCFFHWDSAEIPEDDYYPHPARYGLYYYSHLCENWISGPYGLEERPVRPLHLDQLPPPLRRQVALLRFDSFCFADTCHIQPAEGRVVSSWQAGYLTVDGKTIRPFDRADMGRANLDAYREFYDEVVTSEREWLRGIHIEPPAGQK
jgi:hypothetical protein